MKALRFNFQGRGALAWAFGLYLGGYGVVLGGGLNPVLKGSWPGFERRPASAVAVSGNYAYVATSEGVGLEVIDISDPAHPKRVGQDCSSGQGLGVAASGNQVYLANGPEGLLVLEMHPFVKSIAKEGQDLKLSWEGFGLARLQRATRLTHPDWRDLPGSEATNSEVYATRFRDGGVCTWVVGTRWPIVSKGSHFLQ